MKNTFCTIIAFGFASLLQTTTSTEGLALISPEAQTGLFASSKQTTSTTTVSSDESAPRPGFLRHIAPNFYSIEYPEGWLVEGSSQSHTTIWNRQLAGWSVVFPSNVVKTEVSIQPIAFENAVQNLLSTNNDFYDPGILTRQGDLTVGNKKAFRAWFENGENSEDSIITLVRYSDTQTAYVSSYFTAGETWAIPTIQDIHWSFRAY